MFFSIRVRFGFICAMAQRSSSPELLPFLPLLLKLSSDFHPNLEIEPLRRGARFF